MTIEPEKELDNAETIPQDDPGESTVVSALFTVRSSYTVLFFRLIVT